MNIIILSSSKYKEKDVIYNAISENEYFSFKTYRGQDSKSPLVWMNNPLVVADIELSTDKRFKHPTVKDAKEISSPLTTNNSLEYLYAVNLVAEVANKLLPDEEKHLLYQNIIDAMAALKEGKDINTVILIFLARAIRFAGAELDVEGCICCGSTKNIVAFSFSEGGYVCSNCFDKVEAKADLTKEQMLFIRYLFKSPNYSCLNHERYSLEDKMVIMKHFKEYILDDLGADLNSISMLIK